MSATNVLDTELKYFESKKQAWLKHHESQFALVKGQQLLGTYTTFNEAFEAGLSKIGNQPFLIKRVAEEEEEVQIPALALGLISAHS